jgi:hypothetical protein
VPTREAIVRAAKYWFRERWDALQTAAAPPRQAKPESGIEAAARALSPPAPLPDALVPEFADIINETVHRLRNLLHQSTLKAYYFTDDGRNAFPREFWATTAADGVLEMGTYWPFGHPTAWYEQRPNYPLFLAQLELAALLTEQQASKKRPFPRSKLPDLVAAMRKLSDLPRKAQHQALRDEFPEFNITFPLFREASKQMPRKAGRKPPRQ